MQFPNLPACHLLSGVHICQNPFCQEVTQSQTLSRTRLIVMHSRESPNTKYIKYASFKIIFLCPGILFKYHKSINTNRLVILNTVNVLNISCFAHFQLFCLSNILQSILCSFFIYIQKQACNTLIPQCFQYCFSTRKFPASILYPELSSKSLQQRPERFSNLP